MKNQKRYEKKFSEHLKEIYSAENQLLHTLPEVLQKTKNKDLKTAFANQLRELKSHKKQLQKIARKLNINLPNSGCKMMQKLSKKMKPTALKEKNSNQIKTATFIMDAERMVNYEIEVYKTAMQCANFINNNSIVEQLGKVLKEKNKICKTLTQLAAQKIDNQKTKWENKVRRDRRNA